jgi:hypothetical protein
VGASVVLLVSCGLLLRAVLRVRAVDPGFRSEGVLASSTILPMPRYDSVDVRHRFFDSVLEDVKALPGVSDAAYVTGLPMEMTGRTWRIGVPGRPEQPEGQNSASLRFVTPGFFGTLGIPLRLGRDVSAGDTLSASPVAVVSASFVQRYWPGQDPIGRTFRLWNGDRRIVGVVGDVRVRGLERSSEPQVYLPSEARRAPDTQRWDRGTEENLYRISVPRSLGVSDYRLNPSLKNTRVPSPPPKPTSMRPSCCLPVPNRTPTP